MTKDDSYSIREDIHSLKSKLSLLEWDISHMENSPAKAKKEADAAKLKEQIRKAEKQPEVR